MRITTVAGLALAAITLASPALAVDAAQTGSADGQSADAVWKTIGDFCGIGRGTRPSKSANSGQGRRQDPDADARGQRRHRRREALNWDDTAHSYTYAILEPGPHFRSPTTPRR